MKTNVMVTNIEELYAAVNNPNAQRSVIELAPGKYMLSATDPNGDPRPNGGSLVLPEASVLRGQNEYRDFDGDGVWDPLDPNDPETYADPATETVIDAQNLKGLTGKMNVVSLGLNNQVERLTVRNNVHAGALIGINVKPAQGGLQGVVINCIVERGQRGLRAQHNGMEFTGLDSSAVFDGNISRHNSGTFGFGIQVQNASVNNAAWHVILRHNRSYDNVAGLFVVAVSSSNVAESVESANNIYERNAVGCVLHSGRDAANVGLLQGSDNNQLRFDSVEDAIWNNSGNPGPLGSGGGIDARGGWRTAASASTSSGNQMRLQFIGTRFVERSGSENLSGASRRDMTVFGALGSGGIMPGSGNVVELLIRDSVSDSSPGAFVIIQSVPQAPNKVVVIGTDQAIESANTDITLGP